MGREYKYREETRFHLVFEQLQPLFFEGPKKGKSFIWAFLPVPKVKYFVCQINLFKAYNLDIHTGPKIPFLSNLFVHPFFHQVYNLQMHIDVRKSEIICLISKCRESWR